MGAPNNANGAAVAATAVTVVKQNRAVAPWGSRDDVREMDSRLAVALPNGNKLNPAERKALAQIAVAHQLDPFTGEIYYIPGSGPMVGIKGLRRKAREQLHREREASNFWGNAIEISDPDLRARWHIPDGALAFEFRLFDTITTEFYVKTIKELKDAGMPWDIITQVVGDRPYTSGIGYWTQTDRTKMTPAQCAQKRAEADALKKRFDIDLPFMDDDTPAFAGAWAVSPQDAAQTQAELEPKMTESEPPTVDGEVTDEQHAANAQRLGRDESESLIDDTRKPAQPDPKPDPLADIRARVAQWQAMDNAALVAVREQMMNDYKALGKAHPAIVGAHAAKVSDSAKDIAGKMAAILADIKA